MSLDAISQTIIEYRYWILIPLSIIEGPIVAFAAGALASLGYFNVFALGIFFFIRDMGMDAIYYGLGYYGGKSKRALRVMKFLKIHEGHLDEIRRLWIKHPGRTMFLGKLSYGVASSFVALAGMIRMPMKLFFGYGAIVAIVQFWSLLALGYFFGASLGGTAARVIDNIQLAAIGITVLASVYYIVSFYMRGELKKEAGEK